MTLFVLTPSLAFGAKLVPQEVAPLQPLPPDVKANISGNVNFVNDPTLKREIPTPSPAPLDAGLDKKAQFYGGNSLWGILLAIFVIVVLVAFFRRRKNT